MSFLSVSLSFLNLFIFHSLWPRLPLILRILLIFRKQFNFGLLREDLDEQGEAGQDLSPRFAALAILSPLADNLA